jgi:hypothetical protein
MGLNGCMLTGEFASPLHSPVFSIDLLSVSSCLFPLLIGLLLLQRKPGVWTWYDSL